jgi:hypothetical protein
MKMPGATSIAKAVRGLPAAAAVLLVGIIYALHVNMTFRYEHVNPASNVEEWAYTNIAANNFLRFGFLNSLFLQDHSTSPYPEDHPFVYNHMPAGAENAAAVMLKLTDHNYRLTRFFFAAFMLPGLYFFVRFAGILFGRASLRGAPLVLFAASPFVILSHMEAQIHSVFLLLGFAPLVWLIEHADRGGRWRLWAAAAGLFVLGIYVQYVLVAAIVFGLVYLWALRIVKLRFMHVALGVGAIVAAVVAHLLQNLAYFGPELFVKELMYTLGNRMVGIPSKDELRDFYQSISVVHHGSRPVDPAGFVKTILRNLRVPQWPFLLALLATSAAVYLGLRKKAPVAGESLSGEFVSRFRHVFMLYLWAGLTVVSVILMFPAFTQEVNLGPYGVNHLILGIPSIALIMSALELGHGPEMFSGAGDASAAWRWGASYAIAFLAILHFAQLVVWPGLLAQGFATIVFVGCIAWSWARRSDSNGAGLAGSVRMLAFVLGASSLCALTVGVATEGLALYGQARTPSYLVPLAELKKFHGKLFMTNINLPTVGFFVEGPGYGVCGLEAVGADGKVDSKECKISFVRRVKYWQSQQPDLFFFFWSPRVFPGFSDCMPLTAKLPEGEEALGTCIGKLRHRLETNFPLVHSNPLFEVYDLKGSPPQAK